MTSATSAKRLGRRASVAVLAVIAVAVAVLGLLVAQTSRHSIDGARMNVAGHQRVLSERLVALTLISREADSAGRELWRPRIDATVNELRTASQKLRSVTTGGAVIPADSRAGRDYESLIALQDSVKASANVATEPNATNAQVDSTLAQQKRLSVAIEHVVDELELEWGREVDRLLLLEAACVILLLIAFTFGARLAMQPTQEQLSATISALAESESRTRAVVNAMEDGMCIVDDKGDVTEWNPAALRILGLPKSAVASDIHSVMRRARDEHGRELTPEHAPSIVTIRTAKSVAGMLLTTTTPAGDVRWLHVNTNPLFRGDSPAPHAAVSIFRDVTVARRIEEERVAQAEALELQNQELMSQADALEREQALFRSLVETAGSAIVGLDAEGRVFEWNREAESLFGIKRETALGKSYVDEFVTPRHRKRMRAGIAGVLGGQQVKNHVGPVVNGDEERHVVLWNITPLRAGPGEPVHGLIAAGVDITEREASDERFRLLFERSTDAHMLYDAEGIIDCNDATLQLLRVDSRERLAGRRPGELSPLRQPDGRLSVVVAGQMRERARITGHHRFEWTHRREDGSDFQVEVTLTPLKLHGRPVFLVVWHDITERKEVERALRFAKDAAESANRTKSDFVTRMNHELRTPLTAIIGFSRTLLREKSGPMVPGDRLFVERIRENGMHLLSVINQILDVARVESGRMEIERDTVQMDDLVRETVAMLESTAEAKGIALRCELPERSHPIITDAGKLRQILINLVGNALKFTARGEVLVRLTNDPETGQPREITVRDTGMGIPADRQAKIFEPFEQADSSTRREFGGTGLGLSIVQSFVQLIGGSIELQSELGVGTTFTVRLPRYRASGTVTMVSDGETGVGSV
ncbi:MAG: PAS domain S-box protein [Gemmatimonadota bacterium]|nr:PAS domain S-box protein [Gemmatimonadota bacterium]